MRGNDQELRPGKRQPRAFSGIIGYLIRLGLNTEPIIEPPSAKVKQASASGDKAAAAPEAKQFGFCFSPRDAMSYRLINPHVLCGHPAAGLQLKASEIGRKSLITGVPIERDFIDGLYTRTIAPKLQGEDYDVRAEGFREIRAFGGKRVSVSFYTRSIEGILYYLGEVVRRGAHPESGQSPTPVQVRVGPPQNPFPKETCPFQGNPDDYHGYRCTDLFVVHQGGWEGSGVSVDYDGNRYSISADTSSSWTMPVFDVVKQLQAVNTSAKQLPASNLISVLSN